MGIPPGGLPSGAGPIAPPVYRITINGVEYPCSEWHEIERGEALERVWADGFWDGIGESRVRSPRRCLVASYLDVTSPPFIRLVPPITTITGLTGLDVASFPLYHLQAQQPNGTNVIYFFNGTNRYKVNRDNNTLIEAVSTANVTYGRPALFEGTWRLARGETVDAANLTVGNGAAADTVTAIAGSIKARHFARIQDEGVAKLARASLNQVSLSSDAVTFASGFEVGDTSLNISDLLESQGEILVIKPDGPYRFNSKGDSIQLQKFVGVNPQVSAIDGSNSHGHGPYAYWITRSGIWRILGDNMSPVGFEADPQYFANSTEIEPGTFWLSCTAIGRWLYATRGGQTWQAFIRDDGTLQWYGSIVDGNGGAYQRCVLDGGLGVYVGPALWVASGTSVVRMDLQADGSMRSSLGATRGTAGITSRLRIGTDDFGRPDRQKQLRRMWLVVDTYVSTEQYQLVIIRDGATADQNVGAAIAAAGLAERIPTVGTNDLFFAARYGYNITGVTAGGEPLVRAFGIECHTPSIYQAKIPLTPDSVRGYSMGIQGSLQNLRTLQNAQRVAVKEPELDATRNGYVTASRANVSWFHPGEKVVGAEGDRGIGYEVIVTVEFFDIPSSVA